MAAEIHSVIQTASVCSNLGLNCSMMTRYKNRKLEESSVSMVLLIHTIQDRSSTYTNHNHQKPRSLITQIFIRGFGKMVITYLNRCREEVKVLD